MTPHLLHLYETLHAWRACHGSPPSLDELVRAVGEKRGMVYARQWRLREMGLL